MIFHLLCEGNGIRSIERIVDCSRNTIQTLMGKWYNAVIEFNDNLLVDVHAPIIEADELRTTIGEFGANYKERGTHWIYVGMDRETRLILDFHIGRRNTDDARLFLKKISDRLDFVSEINTDCLMSYVAAIKTTKEGLNWKNHHKIDLMRSRVFSDEDEPGRAATNRIETQNGQIRQHVSKLTRKTRCFAKKKSKLIEHLTLYFFYYNFIKKHRTLKTCPAVKAGLITSPMTIKQVIA